MSLTCIDVSVRAGRREVVAPFSWQHELGGVAWLFGSNGSGKSSLLRVLAGFQRPATGTLSWSVVPEKIFYFSPAISAPSDLRVCDFVALVQSISDTSHDEQLQLLLPPLTDMTNRFRTLSTGEAKRLLLWSILKQNPGPLILDEPYEHLSRDVKPVLTTLLKRWADDAVVVVATNQDVPIQPNDAVLSLNGSRLEIANESRCS